MSDKSEVDKILEEDSDADDVMDVDVNDIEASLTLEEILNEDLEVTSSTVARGGSTSSLSSSAAALVTETNPLLRPAVFHVAKKSTLPSSSSTKTPLEVAQALEESLLAPPSSTLVSPLAVKRKMRLHHGQNMTTRNEHIKKNEKRHAAAQHQEPPLKEQATPQAVSSSSSSSTTTGGASSSSGVVKVEPMAIISKQLEKNAMFRENGPGSPTVVAIQPKFIAIGTSKSLVLVFDHFQNIRHVLRNTNVAENEPHTGIVFSMIYRYRYLYPWDTMISIYVCVCVSDDL
jgi:hypothetical protein